MFADVARLLLWYSPTCSADSSATPRFSLSKKAFDGVRSKDVYRMKCYRTSGFVDETSKSQLRMYFLRKPEFVNASPAEGETRIEQLGDRAFLEVSVAAGVRRRLLRHTGALIPRVSRLCR